MLGFDFQNDASALVATNNATPALQQPNSRGHPLGAHDLVCIAVKMLAVVGERAKFLTALRAQQRSPSHPLPPRPCRRDQGCFRLFDPDRPRIASTELIDLVCGRLADVTEEHRDGRRLDLGL